MKILTAQRLSDGVPVYQAEDGSYVEDIARAKIFESDDEAKDSLGDAGLDEVHVLNAYLVEIGQPGVPVDREQVRETIRAIGPTIHPQFIRAQNKGARKGAGS